MVTAKLDQQVNIGDPLQAATLMGPLVTPKAVQHMMQALEKARAEGVAYDRLTAEAAAR